MAFWEIAFKAGWVSAEKLKLAVKTDSNQFGEITEAEYKAITGQDFKITE